MTRKADNGSTGPSDRRVTFVKSDRAVEVTLKIQREGQVFTAECIELGTAMFGDTYSQAQDALIEAIALQLEALDEHGELERFLSDNGVQIRTYTPAWSPEEPVPA